MIKSKGGSGSVHDCQFNNFIDHSNAYGLDINGYWSSQSAAAGNGIVLTNPSFRNWKGTCSNDATPGPIQVICLSGAPCTNITISDFAMWTESGSSGYFKYENDWGTGGCLATISAHSAFAMINSIIKSAPTGYTAAKMPGDLANIFPLTSSISIPPILTLERRSNCIAWIEQGLCREWRTYELLCMLESIYIAYCRPTCKIKGELSLVQ